MSFQAILRKLAVQFELNAEDRWESDEIIDGIIELIENNWQMQITSGEEFIKPLATMLEEVLGTNKKLFIMDYSPTLADFVIAGYYYTFTDMEEPVRRSII